MINGVDPKIAIHRAFPEISSSEADEMALLGRVNQYPQNTILCQEGAFETIFYIMLEGQVRVSKVINETQDRFLANLGPGDFFGEMALVHNAPRAATVVSTTPVTLLEINKESFENLVRRNSSISMAMVKEVSRRLRENQDLAIEDLRMKAGELAAAYQQLAEIEYARSEFLTVVAHELRTPLTVANGFLQVIRSQKLQGEALYTSLETVGRNLQEIISLVNDILFLQEMDIILPEFQQTDIGVVVAYVVEQQRSRAERNRVGINLSIPPGLPKIFADAKSLERAIASILDNAIKFSPDGGDVDVKISYDDAEVNITVTDHGVGIPREYLNRVFDRFFHLEEVKGYLFRGVGLGLSIARSVIERHEGTIEVESELGKGSAFTVRLKR